MSANHPSGPLKPFWALATEYLSHWAVAGVILTLTGFAPDHWIAYILQFVEVPDGITPSFFSAVDFRLIAVGAGMALIAADVMVQNRNRRKEAVAVTTIIEDKPSIAVLPFVNMSDDKSQDYFADGMTEDIVTGLSCDSRLFVTSRNSTLTYKDNPDDSRTVGKELGVRYVLEGSIRPVNDHLRITLQLSETATGVHVWAEKIDRPATEIFAILDEVVDGLVTTLCANLVVAESNRAQRQRPENLQAWALCVQAEVLFFSQRDSKTTLEAEKLARLATEIEPGYAVCWALLACIASEQIALGMSRKMASDSEAIMSLVSKALGLAPNDPVVLGYCGNASLWAGQHAQAVDYLERSLDINPNSSFSRLSYGAALNTDARPREAIAQLELFLHRSPKDPYIGSAYFYLSFSYLELQDPQQAESAARNCIKHLPGFAWGHVALAMSLAAQGRDAEAQQQVQQLLKLEPDMTRHHVEESIRFVQQEEAADKLIALLRQAWKD